MKNDVLVKLIAWGIEVQHQPLPVRTDEIVPGCVFSLMRGTDEGCSLVLQASRREERVGLPTEQEAVEGVMYAFAEELTGFDSVVAYTTGANFTNNPETAIKPEAGYVRFNLFESHIG